MTFLISALALFILLTVLVLVHEWGHFAAARKAGVVVEEFGFGLPPRARTVFEQGGTVFTLNWVPFGGFVRLKGENALIEKARTSKGSFGAASIPARCVILLAGVFMNFVLALAIFIGGFSFGQWVPTYLSMDAMQAAADRGDITLQLAVRVSDVLPDGNAAKAGVPAGAILSAVNGEAVTRSEEVSALQSNASSVVYTILVPAEGVPVSDWESRDITVSLSDGLAGVVLSSFALELSAPSRGVIEATGLALRESWIMMKQTVAGIGQLFVSLATSATVPQGISGIVGIAQLTHVSVQQGISTYLRLVALLSLSLAALNVLPFPALDGGRLLFVLAEWIGRRPVNRRVEMMINAFGFSFLILLILFITFYDIIRLF